MATPAHPRTKVTLADYMALDEPDGPRFELSEGELIPMSSPTRLHNRLGSHFYTRIEGEIEPRGLGEVTSDTDFLLGPDTVRCPDVAVILASNFRPEYNRQVPIPIAPDIAIEIVSENDRCGALLLKVRQYLEAGTQSVWLLYPDQHEAHRFRSGATAPEVLGPDAEFREPELLPGVSFTLAEYLTCGS